DWKIAQRVQVDVMAHFTTFCFQQRRSRFDSDLFSRAADFEPHVHAHDLRKTDAEVRANEFLKAGESSRKLIGTHRQLGKREISRFRTSCLVCGASTCILGFNHYAWNNSAGGVRYGSRKGPAIGLRNRGQSKSA